MSLYFVRQNHHFQPYHISLCRTVLLYSMYYIATDMTALRHSTLSVLDSWTPP